jgi:hypothetical protein
MKRRMLAICVGLAVAVSAIALQAQGNGAEGTANPQLVGDLAKQLNATPKQAEGAAGALFGLAKSKLKPEDWTKVAGAVPGMDGLLSAAPAMDAATSAMTGGKGAAGGLASMAGAFSKLGLSPSLVSKAVPVLEQYVSKSGGKDIGKLLSGVLK